jgi:hypothetical protein
MQTTDISSPTMHETHGCCALFWDHELSQDSLPRHPNWGAAVVPGGRNRRRPVPTRRALDPENRNGTKHTHILIRLVPCPSHWQSGFRTSSAGLVEFLTAVLGNDKATSPMMSILRLEVARWGTHHVSSHQHQQLAKVFQFCGGDCLVETAC